MSVGAAVLVGAIVGVGGTGVADGTLVAVAGSAWVGTAVGAVATWAGEEHARRSSDRTITRPNRILRMGIDLHEGPARKKEPPTPGAGKMGAVLGHIWL